MSARRRFRPAAAAALLLAAGCSILGADDYRRELGVIEWEGHPPALTVPSTAEVGEDVIVSISTLGGGCMRPGPTESRVRGLQADVTPYDMHPVGDPGACPANVAEYGHTATLRFNQVGTATVRFHGRSYDITGEPTDVTVIRTIDIQPAGAQ